MCVARSRQGLVTTWSLGPDKVSVGFPYRFLDEQSSICQLENQCFFCLDFYYYGDAGICMHMKVVRRALLWCVRMFLVYLCIYRFSPLNHAWLTFLPFWLLINQQVPYRAMLYALIMCDLWTCTLWLTCAAQLVNHNIGWSCCWFCSYRCCKLWLTCAAGLCSGPCWACLCGLADPFHRAFVGPLRTTIDGVTNVDNSVRATP